MIQDGEARGFGYADVEKRIPATVRIKHLLSHTSDGTPGEKFSDDPDRFEYLATILDRQASELNTTLRLENVLQEKRLRQYH